MTDGHSSGLGTHLGNLYRLSDARSRSISAENPTGEKGGGARATTGMGADAARDLGPGWKISPCVSISPGATFEVADIAGPGSIQQIWMTTTAPTRLLTLRIYWDGSDRPSVEVPLGDFFASGWGTFAQISSLAVCVNPANGFNAYWEMPFQARCRITVENLTSDDAIFFYQINYQLTEVPADAGYFHAQFRRSNPLPYREVHTILDGVTGQGHYVGTAMAWGVRNDGWWGEGEVKFYLDGDAEHPTICGTGTEDYFGGAWCFHVNGRYQAYTTPYAGMPTVLLPDGSDPNRTQSRFGLYRWHVTDPVRFSSDLRVTTQALGWRRGSRYLPLTDDIASVAFWYQTLPAPQFPDYPDPDQLEVI
ncbi:glycoside hydrolase family 172 protein [Phytoactinopolyspora limicola]|uniref:glycoside hydrolase family 172 protein n=1 Tax=Phytoactinopolyspora limicola TaxID=2715536 RepID=UPI00140776FE|nr:glycoside hydrolase family 172 protein [Phytoactinopolyspora limicola]